MEQYKNILSLSDDSGNSVTFSTPVQLTIIFSDVHGNSRFGCIIGSEDLLTAISKFWDDLPKDEHSHQKLPHLVEHLRDTSKAISDDTEEAIAKNKSPHTHKLPNMFDRLRKRRGLTERAKVIKFDIDNIIAKKRNYRP